MRNAYAYTIQTRAKLTAYEAQLAGLNLDADGAVELKTRLEVQIPILETALESEDDIFSRTRTVWNAIFSKEKDAWLSEPPKKVSSNEALDEIRGIALGNQQTLAFLVQEVHTYYHIMCVVSHP